jgi:hypothetical protein
MPPITHRGEESFHQHLNAFTRTLVRKQTAIWPRWGMTLIVVPCESECQPSVTVKTDPVPTNWVRFRDTTWDVLGRFVSPESGLHTAVLRDANRFSERYYASGDRRGRFGRRDTNDTQCLTLRLAGCCCFQTLHTGSGPAYPSSVFRANSFAATLLAYSKSRWLAPQCGQASKNRGRSYYGGGPTP